jgi:hypothetical protein
MSSNFRYRRLSRLMCPMPRSSSLQSGRSPGNSDFRRERSRSTATAAPASGRCWTCTRQRSSPSWAMRPGTVRVDIRTVLGELLRHEQHFWYDSARAHGLPAGQDGTTTRVLRQIVAAACLLGGATQDEARVLPGRAPGMSPSVKIAEWLRALYPPDPGQADWIGSVQPDRLAELHVLRELDASPEFSQKCCPPSSAISQSGSMTIRSSCSGGEARSPWRAHERALSRRQLPSGRYIRFIRGVRTASSRPVRPGAACGGSGRKRNRVTECSQFPRSAMRKRAADLYALVIGRYLCLWRVELVDLRRSPDGGCAAMVAMLLEVPLVVLLGAVERVRRGDLSDDLPPQRLLLGVT